jgi:hypothetical protein
MHMTIPIDMVQSLKESLTLGKAALDTSSSTSESRKSLIIFLLLQKWENRYLQGMASSGGNRF